MRSPKKNKKGRGKKFCKKEVVDKKLAKRRYLVKKKISVLVECKFLTPEADIEVKMLLI